MGIYHFYSLLPLESWKIILLREHPVKSGYITIGSHFTLIQKIQLFNSSFIASTFKTNISNKNCLLRTQMTLNNMKIIKDVNLFKQLQCTTLFYLLRTFHLQYGSSERRATFVSLQVRNYIRCLVIIAFAFCTYPQRGGDNFHSFFYILNSIKNCYTRISTVFKFPL